MKSFIFTTFLIASLLATFTSHAQQKEHSIHLGWCYPISNHGVNAAEYSNVFSFHALAGVSKEETGCTISGLTSVIKENASGTQIAGLVNQVGGNSKGILIAGLVNHYDSAKGTQIAGLTNVANESVKGLQIAGLLNTSKQMEGTQIAGLVNVANDVNGFQLAGLVNKAGNVDGSQIGGLVNIAKNVKGFQLAGLVNIADSSDFSLGLINIIKSGEKSISISSDETLTTLASFRSGGRVLYTILGAGYNFKNEDNKYAFEAGLGANLLNKNFSRLRAEAVALNLTDFHHGNYFRSSLRLFPSLKINRFELYGGPTINHVYTNTAEGRGLTKNYIWDYNQGNERNGVYAGVAWGINFVL